MLATITLATQHGWFGVWLGSTLGMVAADALAILAGRKLGRHLPEHAVKAGAAALFFVFGVWLAAEALAGFGGTTIGAVVAGAFDHHVAGWLALGIGVAAVLLTGFGRLMVGRAGAADQAPRVRRPATVWARILFVAAGGARLRRPVLVALDVIDPIARVRRAGHRRRRSGARPARRRAGARHAAGAGVGALPRRRPPGLATGGLHGRVRNPGLTGVVVATAGTLVMVPTLIAVLAAVLVVVAVQVQARAVREPRLARCTARRTPTTSPARAGSSRASWTRPRRACRAARTSGSAEPAQTSVFRMQMARCASRTAWRASAPSPGSASAATFALSPACSSSMTESRAAECSPVPRSALSVLESNSRTTATQHDGRAAVGLGRAQRLRGLRLHVVEPGHHIGRREHSHSSGSWWDP